MKKVLGIASAMLVLAAGFSAQAAEPKSGLKDGDFVGAFNVQDCTGSEKGKSLCYRCKYGAKPTVTIFTRSIDDNVVELVKHIDSQVGKNEEKQMRAFVVLLTDDPDKAEGQLVDVAKKHNIKNVPLTTFDGVAGPPNYKLNKDADVTVLMWNKSKVQVNHGFAKGKLDKKSVKTVASQTTKILE